jgi:hypothetical protein
MSSNGKASNLVDAHAALQWTGRVLAADDVRSRLNGHREVVLSPRTIVTPLAVDDLRSRGIRVIRSDEPNAESRQPKAAWGYAQERPNPLVQSAVEAVRRDGIDLRELRASGESCSRWAKALAECVARGECQGGVLFCQDPGLVCCVGNKLAGLRAVAVVNIAQTERAALTLGANLVAVEMPGRTFFELRQILRIVCRTASPAWPPGVACTLKELEQHAHR